MFFARTPLLRQRQFSSQRKNISFPPLPRQMSGPDQPGWSVYVLRNKRTGEVYTGCSNDVEARLKTHQTHPTRGSSTTRRWVAKHGPDAVCIFAQVGPMTKSAAQSLERKWKRTTVGVGSVEGRIKSFARLLKKSEPNAGLLTPKCRFDPTTMVFTVQCTDSVLCALASTTRNPVKNMRDLPGGYLVGWRPLEDLRTWKRLE